MYLEHTQHMHSWKQLLFTIIILNNLKLICLHMMIYNEYQVPEKNKKINKLLAEGSDLLCLWSFACDIN